MRKSVRKNRLQYRQVIRYRQEFTKSHKIKANGKNKKAMRYYNVKERSFPIGEGIFREWLATNIDRFNHRPRKYGSRFLFEGIIKNISLRLNLWLPESMIYFDDLLEDKNYDHHVVEYIGWEKYDPEKGYYDADRTDHIYDYFPTLEISQTFVHPLHF